jgi:fucose permease
MNRPVNAALATFWLCAGAFLLGRTSGAANMVLGFTALAIGCALLANPPEVKK